MAIASAEQKHSITPITIAHPEEVDVGKLRLFREPS